MLKIWVTGAKGQIGQAVCQEVDNMEYELLKTDVDEVDITDIEEVLRYGDCNRPAVIINCAGITSTEACNSNLIQAYKVNAIGARNLSIVAQKVDAKFVQISTDDVFDGRRMEPYNEYDETCPHTVYGHSKLAGENYVKEFTHKHFILRSTWVYGNGDNFVNRLLERAKNGDKLTVSSDQYGSPTSAKELAKLIMFLIKTNEYGTYHATCKGVCSRYSFAKEILKNAGYRLAVKAVPTKDADWLEKRPSNAVLDNFVMEMIGEYHRQDWKEALKEFMKEGK